MNKLNKGEFFGSHYQKTDYNDFVVTDTEYTHERVDWHYHESPYFTYLIQGKLFEANKKEAYYLDAGSLLFHNWQDAHYNIKPPEYTRGFHIEINANWFKKYDISSYDFEGSIHLENPLVRGLMNAVFLESKTNDVYSQISIEALVVEIFERTKNDHTDAFLKRPDWVKKLQEILVDDMETDFSLTCLSSQLDVHPVHLSRSFHKYFGTTLGTYIRHQKLNKAILLLAAKKVSMTEICYRCGFYDQSHFISNFKRMYRVTPSEFLKRIASC